MLVLSVIACIFALLGLLWLAQNSPGWAGDAALYILLFTKWAVIVTVTLAVILGIAYAISVG